MNMMKMMKEAASMKKEMKQLQKELEGKTVEYSARGGRIKVVARGDMTIESVQIDPQSIEPGRADKLEELILAGVNGALKAAKKKAGSEMSKLAGGSVLGSLLQ